MAQEALDGETLAPCPLPPRMRRQAEAGEQESATGSPEGASAVEGAGGPRAGGSLTAGRGGTQRPWHLGGSCRMALTTEPSRGDMEGREGGNAAKREGKSRREALKKEEGERAQGRDLAGLVRHPLLPANPPALRVLGQQVPGPSSYRPASCILAPKTISSIGGLGPLLEAPPPTRLSRCT